MVITIISFFLKVLAVYFGMGVLFGIYFLFIGATKIDPLMKNSKWIVRLLLFPGVVATWICLLPKLYKK
ncbi:hypothetical protein [Aureivirga sp. CE67]|uniref:hypothetical protein n=1 Tax=Aureivirga sp. CE67 TaxID=1788983 RepID=UPI0018CB4EB7|nr:hypothetical protein [Aureivirga sp. CE67]